jgi:hypothetical protein
MSTTAELARQVEELDKEQGFEFLDALDQVSRRRRQRREDPSGPTGTSRDEVAAWVAKQHLLVDVSVQEIWYLPMGAPADEIRFLELNNRHALPSDQVQPVTFDLDIERAWLTLSVADVTTEILEQIERDPSILPGSWSLEGKQVWRRGA